MQFNLSQQIEKNSKCSKKSEQGFFDGGESAVQLSQVFADEVQAEAQLEQWIKQARDVESEPCQIHSQIQEQENGVQLNANFQFSCQAEAVIFQMKLR